MIVRGQAPETWTSMVVHLLEKEIMLGVSFYLETPSYKIIVGASQVKRRNGF
jgi:hypothetical protein